LGWEKGQGHFLLAGFVKNQYLYSFKYAFFMQKAHKLNEIDSAVNKFEPVTPDHPFYVNFDHVRGDFQEQELMRMLNVSVQNNQYTFDFQSNKSNKTVLFLAGMRGSGKTSELAKYAQRLHSPECFFVVTCNVDEQLDMDRIQYMDIVIFQLEQLLEKAEEEGLNLDDDIIDTMKKWFDERVVEINRSLKKEGSAEIEFGTDKPFSIGSMFSQLLGITTKLKAGLSGSVERADSIRKSFQNRFNDFAQKFNTFIELVNEQLRRKGKGKEILFIIDGLEKTMSADTRRKIIMDESNRIRLIKVNTIFTLPIELMKEEPRIRQFGEIISFPFIKVKERDGQNCENAFQLFEEFVDKRIDAQLFESKAVVHKAIEYSGGSPRQLLQILEQANWFTRTEEGKITMSNMDRAIEKLGNNNARYLEPEDFEMLKALKNDLEQGNPIGFSNNIQNLLEKQIIFEYNDGTYKKVNPLLEVSKLYRFNVLNQK
jgi:hypothetical protein